MFERVIKTELESPILAISFRELKMIVATGLIPLLDLGPYLPPTHKNLLSLIL